MTDRDYWITDVDDENYGAIFRAGKNAPEADCFVNLIERKAFSNYGMVLKPEEEGGAYPALLVDCKQESTYDNTFAGVQISESLVRMLIQSIDGETRIMIAGDVEELEGM